MYTIYTKDNCGWCTKAKALLKESNIDYVEKKYLVDFQRDELAKLLKTERVTLPQTFVDDVCVGGYENLVKYLKEKNNV